MGLRTGCSTEKSPHPGFHLGPPGRQRIPSRPRAAASIAWADDEPRSRPRRDRRVLLAPRRSRGPPMALAVEPGPDRGRRRIDPRQPPHDAAHGLADDRRHPPGGRWFRPAQCRARPGSPAPRLRGVPPRGRCDDREAELLACTAIWNDVGCRGVKSGHPAPARGDCAAGDCADPGALRGARRGCRRTGRDARPARLRERSYRDRALHPRARPAPCTWACAALVGVGAWLAPHPKTPAILRGAIPAVVALAVASVIATIGLDLVGEWAIVLWWMVVTVTAVRSIRDRSIDWAALVLIGLGGWCRCRMASRHRHSWVDRLGRSSFSGPFRTSSRITGWPR